MQAVFSIGDTVRGNVEDERFAVDGVVLQNGDLVFCHYSTGINGFAGAGTIEFAIASAVDPVRSLGSIQRRYWAVDVWPAPWVTSMEEIAGTATVQVILSDMDGHKEMTVPF